MKPRVRGFIYGVAGNAGMGVWAQKPLFTNQIQWIFSISIIFGHRQSFLKNCSPCLFPFWAQQRFLQEKIQFSLESRENILSKHAVCAQFLFIAIETIVSEFKIAAPVPKCRKSMGNISEKFAPVPKPACRATSTAGKYFLRASAPRKSLRAAQKPPRCAKASALRKSLRAASAARRQLPPLTPDDAPSRPAAPPHN